MSIPIGATPVLRGKEADRFVKLVIEFEKHPVKFVATPKLEKARAMVKEYSEKKRDYFSILEHEFKYYLEHQTELVKDYDGKFIVIKDLQVIGSFNSTLEAVEKTTKDHELGTFLVQQCAAGNANYTWTCYSRVAV